MSHVDEGTLHALVDNELDAGERAAVEAHLAACGDCARQFAEATAMARQVVTLLGALDAPTFPVQVLTAPAVVRTPGPLPTPVTLLRPRMVSLRRVAMAASVLLVAGVSYQVGQRGAAAPESVAFDAARRQPANASAVRAVPSVVDAAADSYVAAPTPSVRALRRGGPRGGDAEMASGEVTGAREAPADAAAAEPAPRLVAAPVAAVQVPSSSQIAQKTTDTQGASQRGAPGGAQRRSQQLSQVVVTSASQAPPPAPSQVPAEASSRAASADRAEQVEQRRAGASESVSRERAANVAQQATPEPRTVQAGAQPERDAPARAARAVPAAAPAAPKITPLAGYVAVEDESVPAMTRRRYVSPSGLALELSIVRSFAPTKDSIRAGAAAEFVVSTANGRSTVRWHARGMDYVLHGPLTPDSLVKLATQLKP